MSHTMLLRESGTESGTASGWESGAGTGPAVELRNPRWDRERAPAGGKAIASVEASLPEEEWRTRVVFTFLELLADGTRKEWGAADGHVLRGRAWALFRIPDAAGEPPGGEAPGGEPHSSDGATRRFLFTARHSLSRTVEGPVLQAASRLRPAIAGLLLYAPVREAYLFLEDRKQAAPWLEEIRKAQALRGLAPRAWEIPDADARLAALQDLGSRAAGLFGDSRVGTWARGPMEELLVLHNPGWGPADAWVYVRSRALRRSFARHGWLRPSEGGVQAMLDGLLEPPPGKPPCPWLEPGMRPRLFRSEPVPGRPWAWRRPGDAPGDPGTFRFASRAVVTRYLIGWDGSAAGWDAGLGRRLRMAAGQARTAVPQGFLAGTWHWPDEAGLDLLEALDGVKHLRRHRRAGQACRLRRTVSAGTDFLVGASLPAVLSFPILGMSGRWRTARGPRNAFAWSPSADGACEPLAATCESVSGAAAGGRAPLRISWDGRRFLVAMRGIPAARLGSPEGLAMGLPPGEGAGLIGHLLQAVGFHHVAAVDSGAYRACADLHFARMTQGGDLSAIRERLRRAAASRGALRPAPPEALARAMTVLMRARGPRDAGIVQGMLGACADAAAGADRHKQKWVLRCLSGRHIPPRGHPGREAAKSRALEEGLRLIRDFGILD